MKAAVSLIALRMTAACHSVHVAHGVGCRHLSRIAFECVTAGGGGKACHQITATIDRGDREITGHRAIQRSEVDAGNDCNNQGRSCTQTGAFVVPAVMQLLALIRF